MKVLIKRPLYLGGASYTPDKAGVEIPDKIGDMKVILYSKEAKTAQAKRLAEENEGTELGGPKPPKDKKAPPLDIILPKDCIEYTPEDAKDWTFEGPVLLRGAPRQEEVALKELTPSPGKGEAKVGGPSASAKASP